MLAPKLVIKNLIYFVKGCIIIVVVESIFSVNGVVHTLKQT